MLAHILSLQDLNGQDPKKVEWALGNLIELYALTLFPELQSSNIATPPDARKLALGYARDLVAKAGADSFEVYSTRRQMLRYVDWYAEEADLGDVTGCAEAVCEVLPETEKEDWG
jgi:hypothetical protein